MYIRPLTRRNQDGEVYKRTDQVNGQIRDALTLEPGAMLERARIRNHRVPDYLREECLIYLIREYLVRGTERIAKRLSEILYRRCAKFVNERLRALGPQHVDDAFNDVMKGMYERINDLKSDRGDYFQVRFWVALKALTVKTFGRYIKRIKRDKSNEQDSTWIGAIPGTQGDEDERPDPLDAVADPTIPVEELPKLKEGLNTIRDPRHRSAFVLRYFGSMQTETEDPEEPTISRYFEKTPRTIRNWLKQAEADLEEWRGEAT